MKEIIRDRFLTAEEAAQDERIREQIYKEFPPKLTRDSSEANNQTRKEKQTMQLKSIEEVITLLEAIPPEQWCVDVRTDGSGRHCVIGHLDVIVGGGRIGVWSDSQLRPLVNIYELIEANNGEKWNGGKPDRDTSGEACKARSLAYLKSRLEVAK